MPRPPVIQFSASPPDHHTAILKDELQRVLGRIVAHATVPLHQNAAGTTVTLSGGTATVAPMSSTVDFGDAGVDLVRAVVYGTPPAHDATVQVFNVTTGKVIATATLPAGGSAGQVPGAWTQLQALGGDEHIEVHVVGTGSDAPVLHAVHLQMATASAKA